MVKEQEVWGCWLCHLCSKEKVGSASNRASILILKYSKKWPRDPGSIKGVGNMHKLHGSHSQQLLSQKITLGQQITTNCLLTKTPIINSPTFKVILRTAEKTQLTSINSQELKGKICPSCAHQHTLRTEKEENISETSSIILPTDSGPS